MRTAAMAVLFLLPPGVFAQSSGKESDTLQSLVVEVHQLSLNIAAMSAATQRVQIALFTLQMQDGAVARAVQRADNARAKCVIVEANRGRLMPQVHTLETALASGSADLANGREKVAQEQLAEMKASLDEQTAELQICQAAAMDATGQLQKEQAKLAETQDRIDHLDKALEKLGSGHQ